MLQLSRSPSVLQQRAFLYPRHHASHRHLVAAAVAAPAAPAAPGWQHGAAQQQPLTTAGDVLLKEGDVVDGEVVFSNPKGARVKLLEPFEHLTGYMPERQSPEMPRQDAGSVAGGDTAPSPAGGQPTSHTSHTPHKAAHHRTPHHQHHRAGSVRATSSVLPAGTRRSFVVLSMPTDGRGPLLSAVAYDLKLHMKRMQQLQTEQAIVRAHVHMVNRGGCVCSVLGYQHAFLPWKQLSCPSDGVDGPPQWDPQAEQGKVGQELDVVVKYVDLSTATVELSERAARQLRVSRALSQVMADKQLVAGTVIKVTSSSVTVQLAGFNGTKAVLYWRDVTQAPFSPYLHEVFSEGEVLLAALKSVPRGDMQSSGAPSSWLPISLTTKQLELQAGDMLSLERRAACFKAHEGRVTSECQLDTLP